MLLGNADELPDCRHPVDGDIYNIWPRLGHVPVRRHRHRNLLSRASSGKSGVIEEHHAVVHVQTVRHVTAVVKRDLASFRTSGCGELDLESSTVGSERARADYHVGGALVCVGTGEVGRDVVLDAEFGHVVFRRDFVGYGGEYGHLNGV